MIWRGMVEATVGWGVVLGGLYLNVSMGINDEPVRSLALGTLVTVGSTLGVAATGWVMQRHGNFGWALLSATIAFAIPLAMGLAGATFNPIFGVGMILMPGAAAAIAFEVSAMSPPDVEEQVSNGERPLRRLVPVVALPSQGLGAVVGIAGTL